MKEPTGTSKSQDVQMHSPPIGKAQMDSTANQTQPLQARSSNSGTSFKKSDNSHSSYQHGAGGAVSDTNSEVMTWQAAHKLSAKPEHGQLTSVFQQNFQQLSAMQQQTSQSAAQSAATISVSSPRRPLVVPRTAAAGTAASGAVAGSTGPPSLSVKESAATSTKTTPTSGGVAGTRLASQKGVSSRQRINSTGVGSAAFAGASTANSSSMNAKESPLLGPPLLRKPSDSSAKGQSGVGAPTQSGKQATNSSRQRAVNRTTGNVAKPSDKTANTSHSSGKDNQRDTNNSDVRGASNKAGKNSATDQQQAVSSTTKSGGQMRTTRSKSRTTTAPTVTLESAESDQMDSEKPAGKLTTKPAKKTPNGEDTGERGAQSNGQSHLSSAFMQLDEGGQDVGKYEIDGRIRCESGSLGPIEESKQARLEDGDAKLNESTPSAISAAMKRQADKHNMSFQISESVDSLADNPLCTLIKQFQTQRINAQLTGKIKPTIQQFLDQFEKEMLYLEESYQTQLAARKQQMRLFEQNYGIGKAEQPSGQVQNTPQADQGQVGGLQKHGRGNAPAMQANFGCAQIVADNLDRTSSDVAISALHQDGCMHEESSLVSHQSSYNQNFSSQLGMPAQSELSMSEVYEGYHFMQNSLISFYPKDVRRCIQRRKQLNQTQLSTDKLLTNLKPPKHATKAGKVSKKMNSLAHCQMNMMQVLLQKISRKSKVIRKQEKIVNDNLKRKRIYLEREKFDIMAVLRQTAAANEKDGMQQTTRKASPQANKCLSTVGTHSALAVNVSSTKMTSDEISIVDDQQLRKSGRLMSAQENTLSTTFAEGQSGSQKTQNANASKKQQLGAKQEQINVVKTPEKRSSVQQANQGTDGLANHQQSYMQAEQKVQQALNLSEIEDSFLKASKNYSQKRDSHSNLSASQETFNCGVRGPIQPQLYLSSTVTRNQEPQLISEANFELNMAGTPETARAQVAPCLQDEVPAHYGKGQALQLTAVGISQSQSLLNVSDNQQFRKNQSTQARRTNKGRQALMADQEDIVMDGQVSHITFNDRLNNEGGRGNFAIADLGTKEPQFETSFMKNDSSIKGVKIPDLICKVEPVVFGGSKQNKKAKATKRSAKNEKFNSVSQSDIKRPSDGQERQMEGDQQEVSANNKGGHGSAANGQPVQLAYSQSLHLPAHHQAAMGLGADQASAIFGMQQMPVLDEFASQQQAHQQRGVMVPHQMIMMGNLEMPMHRSQSMMVPQPSYIATTHCIDDMFFDESPAELSSMDNNTQSNQNLTNYSHVANPYEAAKRAFFAQQKNQQHSSGRNNSSAERNGAQLGVKQQVSDPVSNYTAQESNSHSLPQAQEVRHSQQPVEQPSSNHQFISPMQICGQLAATPTPMTKLQENMPMVEGATTPSRFMSGVENLREANQGQLPLPFMNNQQVVFHPQLLMSSGIKDSSHSQVQHLQPHHPHGVDNSALSGASVFLRGGAYTPAAMLAAQHNIADSHRENLNVNAWHLDDNDTQTAHMVDTLIGNSAKTISEEQVRQHSSSQQRSVEEVDIFNHAAFPQQNHQYL